MPLFIIFVFYQIIQLLGAPFIFMYLFFRKFYQKKQAVFTWQRFGFVPAAPLNKKVIWLHAVSVGETLSLEYFITLIKKEIPESICYVTVGTDAAKSLALKTLPADFISFIPYDFLPCMLFAYHRIKPHALIVVEAEIWPNLLMLASIHKTKIYGLNARVNDRSQKNIILLRHLFTPLLNCFDAIFVQSPTDKQKFQALNIPKEKLIVLGNIKAYNVAIKKTECESTLEKKTFDNKILLAGSIHPGELDYYIEVFTKLKPIYQDLKLILAPRHFTWKAELQKSLSYKKFNFFMWDKENSLSSKTNTQSTISYYI
jgi:3-deoxy-D-manno-octulosonic-acid transferase